ncbi:MAG TPA: lytic transglycosylase domain-containing protein [Thermoanaerobaculia bacterium]|jgi:hypothetical protein
MNGRDYRIICSCQRHARKNARWRRALRVAARGVAVLAGIPIALAFFDIPIKAMSLNVAALHGNAMSALTPRVEAERGLPIFTTESVRRQFLAPQTAPRVLSVDRFKEDYFRTQVPYGSIIYREARRNGLSPELVAAMVHTESDFRPGLVSHKSAQGLMQIVPETARLMGIANPFDPEQNIAAGTRYFRYLLDRFEDEKVALAAYNAGEGNVERFGGVPPFAETRDYISRVSGRAWRYRQNVRNTYMTTVRMGTLQ